MKLSYQEMSMITTGLMAYSLIKQEERAHYKEQLKDPSPIKLKGMLMGNKFSLDGEAKIKYLEDNIKEIDLNLAKYNDLVHSIFAEQQRRIETGEYKDE